MSDIYADFAQQIADAEKSVTHRTLNQIEWALAEALADLRAMPKVTDDQIIRSLFTVVASSVYAGEDQTRHTSIAKAIELLTPVFRNEFQRAAMTQVDYKVLLHQMASEVIILDGEAREDRLNELLDETPWLDEDYVPLVLRFTERDLQHYDPAPDSMIAYEVLKDDVMEIVNDTERAMSARGY